MSRSIERIARFGRLIRRHHLLLLKTWFVLAVIRVTLTLRSYRPVVNHIASVSPHGTRSIPLPLLAWAVERMARFVPHASCLTQALALRYLAAREGEPCSIRIGVKNREGAAFEAHAWVMAGGDVIIGGKKERVEEFTPLIDL